MVLSAPALQLFPGKVMREPLGIRARYLRPWSPGFPAPSAYRYGGRALLFLSQKQKLEEARKPFGYARRGAPIGAVRAEVDVPVPHLPSRDSKAAAHAFPAKERAGGRRAPPTFVLPPHPFPP